VSDEVGLEARVGIEVTAFGVEEVGMKMHGGVGGGAEAAGRRGHKSFWTL
jgi:hypothetical protein